MILSGMFGFLLAFLIIGGDVVSAETTVTSDRQSNRDATFRFTFEKAASPVQGDVAAEGQWTIISGVADPAGGDLSKLSDGALPRSSDQPSENFFFAPNTDGGRLVLDLKRTVDITQVRSYSWHSGERGPQVYDLYARDDSVDVSTLQSTSETDAAPLAPTQQGWTKIASVDTRTANAGDRELSRGGGQYAVNVSGIGETIGRYRYLLFDIRRTDAGSRFSNTFFSEIDVLDSQSEVTPAAAVEIEGVETFTIQDGEYEVTIDTSDCPDLTRWAKQELTPVIRQWYPRIVALLPSDGFEAPQKMRIEFSASMDGVAATGGTTVYCSGNWFRRNLQGEAKGAIVHELVHVVQQYGAARRTHPNANPTPGWVIEGIPDYIRWHLYEPAAAKGGVGGRRRADMRYDASYRETASFFAWVIENEAADLLPKLNAAARRGEYSEDFWTEFTGKSVKELAEAWQS